jgi:hypothetical protein
MNCATTNGAACSRAIHSTFRNYPIKFLTFIQALPPLSLPPFSITSAQKNISDSGEKNVLGRSKKTL